MKRIDWLLLRSFIPPLIVWFLVATFIFNMQFLWKYIDDIVGKGLEITIVLELLFYQALAMVPKALVFGVLIASVMTMGNLSEHYELASLKSAGVSLTRVMRPLLFLAVLLGISSYTFADYIIPNAALQFKARLHDIRKKKPALNLEKGQFNYDFKNIVIYIGDKDYDSRHLYDIKLYDHTKGNGQISQTNAKEGELFYSDDKRFLILRLYDGVRYEDLPPQTNRPESAPFLRVMFKEFTAMFDMKQFDMKKTDRDMFKDHYSLLSTRELVKAVDSIELKREKRMITMQKDLYSFFHYQRILTDTANHDSHPYLPISRDSVPAKHLEQLPKTFLETIAPNKQEAMAIRAFGFATQIKNHTASAQKSTRTMDEGIAAHENEVYQKVIYALACLLFLYVGAPMGALIRKGGFGWPILVSFVCFMIFFVLNLLGERLAKSLFFPCWLGSWLPIIVMFPVAIWLTRNAMRDTQPLPKEKIITFFSKIGSALRWLAFWRRKKV